MSKRTKDYYNNLIGEKYNHLTINRWIGYDEKRMSLVEVTCDCGNKCIKKLKYVLNGDTTCCAMIGCEYKACNRERKEKVDKPKKVNKPKKVRENNASRTPMYVSKERKLYQTWRDMKRRCRNPYGSNACYEGKGVCEEWIHDFEAFKKWSYENGFYIQEHIERSADTLSIDRIDSSKGYSPDNCRWITWSENSIRANANRYHDNAVVSLDKHSYDFEVYTFFGMGRREWSRLTQEERSKYRRDYSLK